MTDTKSMSWPDYQALLAELKATYGQDSDLWVFTKVDPPPPDLTVYLDFGI